MGRAGKLGMSWYKLGAVREDGDVIPDGKTQIDSFQEGFTWTLQIRLVGASSWCKMVRMSVCSLTGL